MRLSKQQAERYKRQIVLDQVGVDGQLALAAARVLVVGLGGLGAPVSTYLTAAGVGTLGLIDGDIVDVSNLQRQVIFSEIQVGQAKVQAAKTRLGALNRDLKINIHKLYINAANAEAIIGEYDLVVDCTDNFAARYAINDACLTTGKAFVFGSLYRFEGQVSLFCALGGPCYRCFYPELIKPGCAAVSTISAAVEPAVGAASATEEFSEVAIEALPDALSAVIPNCAEAGILGSLAGVIGSLQATEAIKYLLKAGESLAGRVLIFDGLSMSFSTIKLAAAKDCHCQKTDSRRLVSSASLATTTSSSSSSSATPFSRSSLSSSAPAPPASISAAELCKALEEGEQKIELVDVRALKEHRAMRLKGSRLIPLPDLMERAAELVDGDTFGKTNDGQANDLKAGDGQASDQHSSDHQTNNRIIVVYCRSGVRSRKACTILRECGFGDVRNLTGGILAWYREFEEKMIESDAQW